MEKPVTLVYPTEKFHTAHINTHVYALQKGYTTSARRSINDYCH